jgi:hypothetical protein
MQVEFQVTQKQYNSFLKFYFFKRNIVTRLILLIVLSVWIGGTSSERGHSFISSVFLIRSSITAIVLFLIFALIPYIIARVNLTKALKTNLLTKTKTIFTNDDGIAITTDNENAFWNWETLNKAEIVNGYLFVSLFTNKFYLIPLSFFSTNNEAINFLGVIKNGIQKVRGKSKLRKIRNLYYWGLVGFIPNFGVIAGIILIIKGFQYNKVKLMLVGVADILFTVFFWIIVFPLLNPDGFKDISQMQLNSLVKNVEFYKLQHGQYPDSLQQLLKDDQLAPINDAIQSDNHRQNTYYHYEKIRDKYLLFSSGKDGIPNTKDDLFPQVNIDSSKIGLLKSK